MVRDPYFVKGLEDLLELCALKLKVESAEELGEPILDLILGQGAALVSVHDLKLASQILELHVAASADGQRLADPANGGGGTKQLLSSVKKSTSELPEKTNKKQRKPKKQRNKETTKREGEKGRRRRRRRRRNPIRGQTGEEEAGSLT